LVGLFDIMNGEPTPTHYTEYNVKSEIPPPKNAGGMYHLSDMSVSGWVDNHSCYVGFRERYPLNKSLNDDGAVILITRLEGKL
jgi:hypothetical protein